jgi:hypothetical protein
MPVVMGFLSSDDCQGKLIVGLNYYTASPRSSGYIRIYSL